jgi:hypothetical protein
MPTNRTIQRHDRRPRVRVTRDMIDLYRRGREILSRTGRDKHGYFELGEYHAEFIGIIHKLDVALGWGEPWRLWLWGVLDPALPNALDPSDPDYDEWQETIRAKHAIDDAMPKLVPAE